MKSGFLIRGAELLTKWWPQLFQMFGIVLFSLANFGDSHDHVNLGVTSVHRAYLFAAGVVTFVVGSIATTRNVQEKDALAKQVADLELELSSSKEALRAQLRVELVQLARQLKFFSTERISVFALDGESLRLVARYSNNPQLISPGRSSYPIDQGCLGRAWSDGQSSADLPNAAVDLDGWQRKQLEDYEIPTSDSARFTMKSRTYFAFRIDGLIQEPLGVVVFESQLAPAELPGPPGQHLTMDELRKVIKGPEGERLQCMLSSSHR